MTQIERLSTDLRKMSNGHEPSNIFVYHDGFSATFTEEIAALRVSQHYPLAKSRWLNTVRKWQVSVKN